MSIRRVLALTMWATLGLGALGCSAEDAAPQALFTGGEALEARDQAVVRSRRVTNLFDVAVHDQLRVGDGWDAIRLDLFEDVSQTATLVAVERTARGWVLEGELLDTDGHVTLAVADDTFAGTIRAGHRLYQLAHGPEGHYVAEIDETRVGEHPPVLPDVAPLALDAVAEAPPLDEGAATVDVMVVYTSDALHYAGGEPGMAALIDLAVHETNKSYVTSGVAMRVHVVHQRLVDYSESQFSWSDTLGRLRGQTDGYMDDIHADRDFYGADHVVLIVDKVTSAAGIGYQMVASTASVFDAFAFSVVSRSYAAGAYTFAHELGHNMGASHDHDNAQITGYFPDSHGLQVPSAGVSTIMAYACSNCARVPRWSNPELSYDGVPLGLTDYADNARTLRVTKNVVSKFRDRGRVLVKVPRNVVLQDLSETP